MSSKVFISSTCYDLIDLRAELEVFFREAALIPILSDSALSDFEVPTNANAIEICLANVRDCDQFLIILSRRYGPLLGSCGFENISATHLEYREAVKAKRPIRMYVRDRLVADHDIWRRNAKSKDYEPIWCSKRDMGLFELIDEHTALTNTETNNWMWTFRNSVELRQRMAIDFKEASGRAILEKLIQAGRLPHLTIEGSAQSWTSTSILIALRVRNVGAAVALYPTVTINRDPSTVRHLASLHSMELQMLNWNFHRPEHAHIHLRIECAYITLEGHKLSDEGELTASISQDGSQVLFQHIAKKYHHSQGLNFVTV